MKGGLTPDVSNPLASSKQAGFGDRQCGFAANQATMCLAAYFGIIAFAPVRHVVADPAVRVRRPDELAGLLQARREASLLDGGQQFRVWQFRSGIPRQPKMSFFSGVCDKHRDCSFGPDTPSFVDI
jgi:hypothetical protein